MNCAHCRTLMNEALAAGATDLPAEIEGHLEHCPACRRVRRELFDLDRLLAGALRTDPQYPLGDAVLDELARRRPKTTRKPAMLRNMKIFGVGAVAAAVLIAAAVVVLSVPGGAVPAASAAEILAAGAARAAGLRAIHLHCRMRTVPTSGFSHIALGADFADVDIWRQFDGAGLYRLEKPSRTLVYDGREMVVLIRADGGNIAARFEGDRGFDAGWLVDLTDLNATLTRQMSANNFGSSQTTIEHREVDGRQRLVVLVEVSADEVDEYLLNKSIDLSNCRREFEFDPETQRLLAMRIIVHAEDRDVTVFEIADIEYDVELPTDFYVLELPEDVAWWKFPGMAGEEAKGYPASMDPREVVKAFFAACEAQRWDEIEDFFPMVANEALRQRLADGFKGFKIISVGEPFQAKPFPGWFVPYEIESPLMGRHKKGNMSIRHDNPANIWIFDGGF